MDDKMTDRKELRRMGQRIRRELGLGDDRAAELLPGLDSLQDEMIFGRVWSRPGLSRKDRMLATLSALTSMQFLPQLAIYTGAALHIGMSPRTIQEVVLHCSIYSGMPTAENALKAIADEFKERGVMQPEATAGEHDLDELLEMGKDMMHALHGERAEGGYAAPDSAASELYSTAIQYLYGEVWHRPGLSMRQRMICSIACFTARQMIAQQRKWFPSAQKNVGLSRDEIHEVISQTAHYSGFPPALNALVVAQEVLD